MTYKEFILNLPQTVKVFDPSLRRNIILDLTKNEESYITRSNMGTAARRVYHYWSFENVFAYLYSRYSENEGSEVV